MFMICELNNYTVFAICWETTNKIYDLNIIIFKSYVSVGNCQLQASLFWLKYVILLCHLIPNFT